MLRSDPLPPDAATWRQRLHTVIFEADTPIMAVPTGIVSSEMTSRRRTGTSRQSCPACGREGHDRDAVHCKFCGGLLHV
jgi:voltage-gated potassium channel